LGWPWVSSCGSCPSKPSGPSKLGFHPTTPPRLTLIYSALQDFNSTEKTFEGIVTLRTTKHIKNFHKWKKSVGHDSMAIHMTNEEWTEEQWIRNEVGAFYRNIWDIFLGIHQWGLSHPMLLGWDCAWCTPFSL